MTVRFGNNRLGFYIFVFVLSGTILGLSANFASLFVPTFHTAFIIFTLVVAALNIFIFLLTLQWSQPWSEAIVLFVFSVLWLTMGAWTTDIIGHVQCDELGGQRLPTKNNGTMSARAHCSEMKVIQAFSWALFAVFVIALYILFQLVEQARRFGRFNIWSEPIRELPWFGEMPGYYNTHTSGPAGAVPYPTGGGYPGYPYPMMPIQSPGHSIIIQPGLNGAPPTVTQVPMSA